MVAKPLRMLHTAAIFRGGSQILAKNRITVNLDDGEYQALQQVAVRADRSLAWLGRRAIRELLERESAQLTLEFLEERTATGRSAQK